MRDDVVDASFGCLHNFSHDVVSGLLKVGESCAEDGCFGSFADGEAHGEDAG